MIKIFCLYSESHRQMFLDIYLPSLCGINDRGLIIENIYINNEGNGDYLNSEYLSFMHMKSEMVARLIKENYGKTIVISDADICWFKPFSHIVELIDKDVWFSKESLDDLWVDQANVGLEVIKCSPTTEMFFRTACEQFEEQCEPYQRVVNQLLGSIEWGLLPVEFANTSTVKNAAEVICYHTICTAPRDGQSSIELKIKQFEEFIESRKLATVV